MASSSDDPPAVRRLSLRSTDLDEVRSFGGRYFYPRRFLRMLPGAPGLAAGFDLLQLGPVTIGDVWYGTDVTLGYDDPDGYQVGVPMGGHLLATQGGRSIVGAGDQAPVFRMGEDVVLDHWSADCRQLGVKIRPDVLESRLQALLDEPVDLPIRLPAQLDIGTGAGRSWATLVRFVAGEFHHGAGALDVPRFAASVCETLTTGLLMALDHPYSAALHRSVQVYRPQPVRRAIDAIQARPEHPFTAEELARSAGVGVRTLQAGFQRYVGKSPLAYLRDVRLAHAHAELLTSDQRRTTVAEVAHRWGFPHVSRFAGAYRARYHTTPSRTLRQLDR